jgi:hypothetical protein
VKIDPRQKAMIDALVEQQERKRSGRRWILWLSVLSSSLASLYAFNHGLITGWFGNIVAIAGVAGVFLFLAFLSTLPFGRGDSSFSWWWLR